MSLCQCGCGGNAPLYKRTNNAQGAVAGQQARFIKGHGRKVGRRPEFYYTDRAQGHPRADKTTHTVLRHILIAERALGHYLPRGAEVHHVDEDKHNNANGNLVICQDRHYHVLLHRRAAVVRRGGNPNTQRFCRLCSTVKDLNAFPRDSSISDGHRSYCKACASTSRKSYYRRVEKPTCQAISS